jgi:RimJ/RimL family protein N-acetyltransferase
MVGLHVLNTRHGRCFVDRWPEPRVALVQVGANFALAGDPAALHPADLQAVVGFIDAADAFEPLLRAARPSLSTWHRVVQVLPHDTPLSSDSRVRRLVAEDSLALRGLNPDLAWISSTWDGPDGLASSGFGWGAFVDGKLASVACSFFVGKRYEDIGLVTEPEQRSRGLSTACAAAVCGDIRARGRLPSWTTSTDNRASLRVAERLGFVFQRRDRLFVLGR